MLESQMYQCPYCWEGVEALLDLSAGDQEYVEDCPVCCRPTRITATLDETGRDFVLTVVPED